MAGPPARRRGPVAATCSPRWRGLASRGSSRAPLLFYGSALPSTPRRAVLVLVDPKRTLDRAERSAACRRGRPGLLVHPADGAPRPRGRRLPAPERVLEEAAGRGAAWAVRRRAGAAVGSTPPRSTLPGHVTRWRRRPRPCAAVARVRLSGRRPRSVWRGPSRGGETVPDLATGLLPGPAPGAGRERALLTGFRLPSLRWPWSRGYLTDRRQTREQARAPSRSRPSTPRPAGPGRLQRATSSPSVHGIGRDAALSTAASAGPSDYLSWLRPGDKLYRPSDQSSCQPLLRRSTPSCRPGARVDAKGQGPPAGPRYGAQLAGCTRRMPPRPPSGPTPPGSGAGDASLSPNPLQYRHRESGRHGARCRWTVCSAATRLRQDEVAAGPPSMR